MQAILGDIGALMGVTGSFVCGRDGALVGRAMPALTEDGSLATIGRSLMRTFAGLEADRHKRPTELDLVFKGGRLLVKNLGGGCLCVLCSRQANVAMVNMTANMAARKLKEALVAPGVAPVIAEPPAPSAAAPVSPLPASAAAAPAAASAVAAQGPCLGPSKFAQIEHELARAVGPVAMLVVDDAVAAMGFTRETLPSASAQTWLERLGAEIADPGKRAQFMQAARQIVPPS